MTIVWAENALSDLAEITDYHAYRSPAFLNRLLNGIDDVLARLSKHPGSGQQVAFHPLRKARPQPGKYLLFYRVTANGVEVARIIHGERDWFTEL